MGIEMRNSSNSRSYHCMTKTTHLSDEPFFVSSVCSVVHKEIRKVPMGCALLNYELLIINYEL